MIIIMGRITQSDMGDVYLDLQLFDIGSHSVETVKEAMVNLRCGNPHYIITQVEKAQIPCQSNPEVDVRICSLARLLLWNRLTCGLPDEAVILENRLHEFLTLPKPFVASLLLIWRQDEEEGFKRLDRKHRQAIFVELERRIKRHYHLL